MKYINQTRLTIPCKSINESFARAAIAAFAAQLDPTIEEINDIKTAVSEAVTNAIVHAYPEEMGTIRIIRLRFFKGLTQEQVAKIMNTTQVQVSRIQKKAIERLRWRVG